MNPTTRITAAAVAAMGVASVLGVIVLAAIQRQVPEILAQLATGSLAGLAGIAIPTVSVQHGGPATPPQAPALSTLLPSPPPPPPPSRVDGQPV